MSFRKIRSLVVFGGVIVLASLSQNAVAISQAPPRRQSGLTDALWREDLDFLSKTVAEKHRHPFDMSPKADFDKAAAELREKIPTLADHEIVVGLIKLVAFLRDGHSRLTLPPSPVADTQSHTATAAPKGGIFFHALPVRFYAFSDGLYIQAAPADRRELVGARVLRIGTATVEAAWDAVRPVVSYDSEMWLKQTAPQYLRIPEVLEACGVADSLDRIPLVLEKDGRTWTVELEPLRPGPEPALAAWSDITGTAKPHFLEHADQPFRFEFLTDRKALYIQVNGVQDGPDETLAAFSARAAAEARARGAEKLILDLRLNGGGNNYLNRGLVLSLIGLDDLNRYGRFFVIIGRNTFSAAMNLVSALERWSEAIFVGEPTGNMPSLYGDARRYVLPNSGLTVRLSAVYWRDDDSNERRPWVAPDIPAVPSWADYAAGRDPALDACLAYQARESLLDQLKEKLKWGGIQAAASHYYKYRNSPETARVPTEQVLLDLAEFLVADDKTAEATEILRRAVVEYPRSFDAQLALGRRLVEQGAGQEALGPLKKAQALKPADPTAAALLKKAEETARIKK